MKYGPNIESLKADIKRFFAILDTTEESDNGRVFHPTTIGSCRVMTGIELEAILKRLKAYSEE